MRGWRVHLYSVFCIGVTFWGKLQNSSIYSWFVTSFSSFNVKTIAVESPSGLLADKVNYWTHPWSSSVTLQTQHPQVLLLICWDFNNASSSFALSTVDLWCLLLSLGSEIWVSKVISPPTKVPGTFARGSRFDTMKKAALVNFIFQCKIKSNSTSLSVTLVLLHSCSLWLNHCHFSSGVWLANVSLRVCRVCEMASQPAYAVGCGQGYFKIALVCMFLKLNMTPLASRSSFQNQNHMTSIIPRGHLVWQSTKPCNTKCCAKT